jgi:DHA1 family multidrug resistance protein-like MFS transporter
VAYLFFDQPWWFIAVRAVEGISTAALMPAARAYISDVIVPEKRGEAFGLYGAAISGGFMLGPAAGGFIGGSFGFTMPFIFCAVTGVLAVGLAICLLPESHHSKKTTKVQLVAAETTITTPVQPNSSFSSNLLGLYFIGAYIIMFGLQFVMSLMGTVWNIWLNDQGASLNQIGLTYTIFGLPAMFVTPFFGRMIDRSQRQAYYYLGGGIVLAVVYGSYALATNHFLVIVTLSLIESLMFALVQPIVDRYTAEIIPANTRGTGQALFSMFSTLGGFAGSMLTTSVYGWWVGAPFLMAGTVQLTATVIGGIIIWRYQQRQLNKSLSVAVANSTEEVEQRVVPQEGELVSAHS